MAKGAAAAAPARMHISVELMYDLLHLTPEAYRLWSRCLLASLEPMLAPPKRGRGANRSSEQADCVGRSCRGSDVDLA